MEFIQLRAEWGGIALDDLLNIVVRYGLWGYYGMGSEPLGQNYKGTIIDQLLLSHFATFFKYVI